MRRFTTMIMIGALAVAACSGDTVGEVASELENATDATIGDAAEQNAMQLAADVEEQMQTLTDEIESSGAADDLRGAWSNIQTEVAAAIASMQTDGSIVTDGLNEALEDFQTELEATGDEVAPEVRSAWESLRSSIEQMMS